ncbi:unknown [[Mannheimia] succiniciproducens MBEL55E]|uniref:Uncharacterized protein n=1 Tax=Mannheimia succiniciproducens (strain KCTC 0769BP / MBEL55E) TaxID=221988 RepID=Q65W59_MANSM|nr:unknown [[Mannheimia] succiniciproducens MBEL55E]
MTNGKRHNSPTYVSNKNVNFCKKGGYFSDLVYKNKSASWKNHQKRPHFFPIALIIDK